MVSLIRTSNHFLFFSSPPPPHSVPISSPNFSSFYSCLIHPRRQHHSLSFNFLVLKPSDTLGFSGFGSPVLLLQRGSCSGSGLVRIRSKGWENDGDPALEKEVLKFMRSSKNPNAFPTKKDLIDAGRMDIVEAIEKQRGWLSLGWDLDEKEESVQENEFQGLNSRRRGEDFDIDLLENDSRIYQQRFDSGGESDSLEGIEAGTSGRAMRMEGEEEDAGIEGILSRLEKERSLSYGFGPRQKKSTGPVRKNDSGDDWLGTSMVSGHERGSRSASLSPSNNVFNDSEGTDSWEGSFSDFDGMQNSLQSEMRRASSTQSEGFSEFEFEAAEVRKHVATDDMMVPRNIRTVNAGSEEIDPNQIQSRLQHLELELSSALRVLSSRTEPTDIVVSQKGSGGSSEKLHELSDAWEFQETEIMNVRDKLRSTRAKLAVLEGKMSLALIEAQKMMEVKQKRIDGARKALYLLRTTCIVWPNSASEVLLSGSFDGWTSQRKMERSSSGIFSLCLKLYPGRYEFKFIVDGVWKIDPLRPIVHNNGHENNLLIIS
ncbi:hypothetical protein BVC80_9097g174 [Macleaya cordata]|uniref:AMP-activated protein kinase glycogen-binding domain-containing protein n=1 Tax=Macleaya cordata TaxID=56857 RepID=A0A200QF64_MACCD|nr:hypothetical protein BVC80_9097g174 [Macleaya cordata]